jgi:hypothetical protein
LTLPVITCLYKTRDLTSLSKIATSVLHVWTAHSVCEKILIVLFLLTTPFLRARVQPDGTGYCAYLRSPLIDHNFSFVSD